MTVEEGEVRVDVGTLSDEALEDALWRVGEGSYKPEASLLLLSFYGHWIRRPAFRAHITVVAAEHDPDGPLFAEVDWDGVVAELDRPYDPTIEGDQLTHATARELRVLRIAASLRGSGLVDLSDVIDAGFDDTNARLVQAAVVHSMRGFGGAAHLWPTR